MAARAVVKAPEYGAGPVSGGKRRSITAIQKAVLSWIAQRRREGTPATYQDIADEFGWRSVSTARDHIRALARKGLLRQAGKARSLQVTDEGERLASVVSPQAPLRKNEFPLSSQAIEALEPLLVKRRFKAGSFLWVSGDLPKFLIRIDRGRVRISRPVGAQKSINIYEFSEGDIFGFLPLLDGEPYPADALVIEDLECSILSRSALLAALRSNPELTISLLQILGRRFRGAFEKVERLSVRGALARFAYYLLELAEAQGKSLKAPILVSVPVPLSELANSLGFSPESLSRAITRFEALGAIRRLGKNRFQIMDLAALRAATLSSSVLL